MSILSILSRYKKITVVGISANPAVFWLQPGAENAEAEEAARKLGIEVISGDCIYQEVRRNLKTDAGEI